MRRFGLVLLLALAMPYPSAAQSAFDIGFGGGPTPVASFFAFDAGFTGGVDTALCGPDQVQGGRFWLVTSTARSGGLVHLFLGFPNATDTGIDFVFFTTWAPYGPAWTGGVAVTCSLRMFADHTDVFVTTGAGPGGGPHIIVWRVVH